MNNQSMIDFDSLIRAYISRSAFAYLRKLYSLLSLLFRTTTMSQQSEPPLPPFDPTKPSVPISYPIETLEELRSRAYFKSFHYPFNISSVPLQPASSSSDLRPKMLVCHDMEGGYVDDKWVQGGMNEGAYAIWHWYLIDVFVYFSHSLVTLPPPCWTNTAHRHGVKVLGTFITEWEKGTEICNEMFKTKESAHMYAELLAELAVTLRFDGWLINMEVKLDVALIPNLKEFVSHLNQTMHSLMPGSLVIWYDSITIDGDLDWQDQLNGKNKPFFDICDGIFVNYTWKKDYPELSAEVAGSRKFDVYMGIDVFGRNTYGGGQWQTDVALNAIKKGGVSAAIFAPGWIYETKQEPNFQTAQNRWWDLVEKSWGITKHYPSRLPFYTNFDQGHGFHVSVEGEKVADARWNNISSQGFQPFLEYIDDLSPNGFQVFAGFKEPSYSGGGNITFKGTLDGNADFTILLFKGELFLGNLPIYITYSVKLEENARLGLSLELSSSTKERTTVLVTSGDIHQISSKYNKVLVPRLVKTADLRPGWVKNVVGIAMNGHTMTELHAICYRSKPERNQLEYFAVLGDIGIKTSTMNAVFPPSSWLVDGEYVNWTSDKISKTVSLKITWNLKGEIDTVFERYNIYVQNLSKQGVTECYIGVAHVRTYYVSDLFIPHGTYSLKFIIQVCGVDGSCQKLEDSPFYQLDVEENKLDKDVSEELTHIYPQDNCSTPSCNDSTSINLSKTQASPREELQLPIRGIVNVCFCLLFGILVFIYVHYVGFNMLFGAE